VEIEHKDIPLKLRAAYKAAEKSTDRSTRNGAILVKDGWNLISACNSHVPGYGGMECDHERPLKYSITEHAERAVILAAARKGIKTEGLTLVANWVACPDCARAIVLAGIETVVCHWECQQRTPERWFDLVATGMDIMTHGGVNIIQWEGKVGGVHNINNGELWAP
jgi:deoxycytidylate deaminase